MLAILVLAALLGRTRSDPAHDVIDHFRAAQCEIQKDWTFSDDWLCASPEVHGHVTKTAVGSQSVGSIVNWVVSAAERYQFEGLPLFAPCQLFVSHKYKFIFVRQPKSSSSAILVELKNTFCGATCDASQLLEVRSVPDSAWKSYFVFTWIRNPFTRVASAFDMFNKAFLFQRQGPLGHDVGPRCSVDIGRFAQNVNSMRTVCQERGCCPYIQPLKMWLPSFVDQHINDQAHCVFSTQGDLMVDFIGRSEFIADDWALFLAEVNRRTGGNFTARTIANPNGHGSAATGGIEHLCSSDRMRAMYNQTIMRNVAMQYASDLHRFRYTISGGANAADTARTTSTL